MLPQRIGMRVRLLGCTDKMDTASCLEILCSMGQCEYTITIIGTLMGDGGFPPRLFVVPTTDVPSKCIVVRRDKYSMIVFIGKNDVYCYRIDLIDDVEVVSVCGEKDYHYVRELIHKRTSDTNIAIADTTIG